jgi:hypothetical protein
LNANDGINAGSRRVQEDQSRIPHIKSTSNGLPPSGTQISQDKRNLFLKLRAERIDDALKLGTVRSPRQKDLDDGRLLADDVKPAVTWRTAQHNDGHHRQDHQRPADEHC